MSIVRVAQAANVSYATAWRIINNQPGGSREAVQAVKDAMAQLGYEPAIARRRGRRPNSPDGIRTRNIALLHLRKGSSISSSILTAVQRALAERNLNLMFAYCETADGLPEAVRSGNVDGVLGYGEFPNEAINRNLQKIPAVWLMSRQDPSPDTWGDRVKPDHYAIGQIGASYLLSKGHKELAFLNPLAGFTIYHQRLASFRSTVEAAGLTAQVFTSSSGTDDYNMEAEALVEQWVAASPRPTGVMVPVDRVTMFIYRHLERRGFQPGRDLEIVSCDNETELLSLMHPSPASIDLNRSMIARLAVERLLWRMKNGVASPSVVMTVNPTLVLPQEHGRNGNGNGYANGRGNGDGEGNLDGKVLAAAGNGDGNGRKTN